MADHQLTEATRDHYNKLGSEGDKFSCRINVEDLSDQHKEILKHLHKDVTDRYYGSGLSIPENVKGKRVLDIGCGSGSLVFILSKLVGPTGSVVGIDIAEGLIQTAKKLTDYHCRQWGYDKPNCEFYVQNAETMDETFPAEDFDVVVSNGVFCTLPNKERVFQAAYKLLKPGGLFFLNDAYAEKDAPQQCAKNAALWSECTVGSMRWDTLACTANSIGFSTPYLTSVAPMGINNHLFKEMLKNNRYACAGWRLFKLDPKAAKQGPSLVTYNGGISDYPDAFPWDVDTTFKKGVGVEVDGELATLLSSTYLSPCFSFQPASGQPSTPRNQNPFQLMDKLKAEGKLPKEIYFVE